MTTPARLHPAPNGAPGSPRDAARPPRVLPNGYWLAPFPIYGSEYPSADDPVEAARRIASCLTAGIDSFIDLREQPHALGEYDDLLAVEAEHRGAPIAYERIPLVDREAPRDFASLAPIIAGIDGALAAGRTVCVHCHAGIGRTAMVLAAFLTTRGWSAAAALATVQQRYWETPLGSCLWLSSPQSPAQRALVAAWADWARVAYRGSPDGPSIPSPFDQELHVAPHR